MKRILKYPGSKWNVAENIVKLIPVHHSYVEAFFGSGAILFSKAPSAIETVNDLDGDVCNLFECIKLYPEKIARLVMTTPYSREIYNQTYEDSVPADKFERACKFLIRCWQGYGYRTNGAKVGWKNDVQGRERAYALWDWYRLPDWIIDIAERLRKVQIENQPAIEVIKRFNHPNVFMYLDPPYVMGTRNGKQYKHEMDDDDQKELLETIVQSQAKIMISGYESDLYNNRLQGWHKEMFSSCAERGAPRKEIAWMNYEPVRQMSIADYPEMLLG